MSPQDGDPETLGEDPRLAGESMSAEMIQDAGQSGVTSRVMALTYCLPTPLRTLLKRFYLPTYRTYLKIRYVRKGRFAYLGSGFRLSRKPPYLVTIGEYTHAEESNVWDAQLGSIVVGKRCWFGLYNIVMGPVDIGDGFSSGPFIAILGPYHALRGIEPAKMGKTVIGNNVWVSTGVIIHFGVKIGDGAIVAPGAVVTKDVVPGAYVAGNPARDITRFSGLGAILERRAKPGDGS